MGAIAIAESGGTPRAAYTTRTSGDVGYPYPATGEGATGLWQIEWPLHNTLLSQVTGGKTTREALATPTTNAKMAIALFGSNGAGIGNWKGDATYDQWSAAGSPQHPSEVAVIGYLTKLGLGSDATQAGTIPAGTGTGGAASSTGPAGGGPTGLTPIDMLFYPGAALEGFVRLGEIILGAGLLVLAVVAFIAALLGNSAKPSTLIAGVVPGGKVLAGAWGGAR
jgi:hypothetical protein